MESAYTASPLLLLPPSIKSKPTLPDMPYEILSHIIALSLSSPLVSIEIKGPTGHSFRPWAELSPCLLLCRRIATVAREYLQHPRRQITLTLSSFDGTRKSSFDYCYPLLEQILSARLLTLENNPAEMSLGFAYLHHEMRKMDRRTTREGVIIANNIHQALDIIDEERYTNVWVDGGATVSSFIRRKLVSEMVLTTIPIAIGNGVRLFQDLKTDLKLDIVASEVLDELLMTKYRVRYDP
ncbi:uncharacterized protein AB675_7945 [Cyphellophora attinorum]|uniref:2,5-diamino-6-ribosylamino-4(3H)-pyrimidinone 5'-phosphate reductase n=1 Tax=Cyphellophora attinorum TaxID=1664694 RepID=A0A0N0NN65_9EURO|nr:uncharacterized protein AB675_7945 [Phialophora attinorum]KPI41261.1 hypothetical protein AB675_7945 [Phialophora attinorum]